MRLFSITFLSFIFLGLLFTQSLFAGHVEILLPVQRSPVPCQIILEKIGFDILTQNSTHNSNSPGLTPEAAVDLQWQFIRPDYEHEFGVDLISRVEVGDRTRPPPAENVAYLDLTHDAQEQNILGWMRVVSNRAFNLQSNNALEFDPTSIPRNGLLPMERMEESSQNLALLWNHPDFRSEMEKLYPELRNRWSSINLDHRIEPGRLRASEDLLPPKNVCCDFQNSNRFAVFTDFLSALSSSITLPETSSSPIVVILINKARVSLHAANGFWEIPPALVRRLVPGLDPSWRIMFRPLSDIRALYVSNFENAFRQTVKDYQLIYGNRSHEPQLETSDGIRLERYPDLYSPSALNESAHKLTEALNQLDPRLQRTMSRAQFLLASVHLDLGNIEEASRALKYISGRNDIPTESQSKISALNDRTVRQMQLRLAVQERFDPLHHTGNFSRAYDFLNNHETILRFGDLNEAKIPLGLVDYYRVWLSLESGNHDRAKTEITRVLDSAKHEWDLPGQNRVRMLTRFLYDPETKEGNAQAALHHVNRFLWVPPYGLSRSFRLYRSKLLRALGMREDAAREQAISEFLP